MSSSFASAPCRSRDRLMDHSQLHIATRLIFGENSIDQIGDHVGECGGTRAMIVTDQGVAGAGHADRAVKSIEKAGLALVLFDGVRENPTTIDVEACLDVAKSSNINLFIGLGGGSSIDTARACNFLLTNGGRMQDYWGTGKATKPMLPMIAVPTTTGTGSEMQSYALIADAKTHQKMACGDKKAAAKVAILDPTLSRTQPREVIAHTGLDCIAHALETAVTTKRNDISMGFSREAARLAFAHFGRILDDPDDLESQGQMLLAAAYAGIAIEHSMLGAAHAMANPLTADFDIAHGQAVGMMLPHVVQFNADCDETSLEYAKLAKECGIAPPDATTVEAREILLTMIRDMLQQADMPTSLRDCGVPGDAIDSLVEGANRQWTAQFNPRAVSEQDFRAMYRAAL